MKKMIAAILLLTMVLCLCACTQAPKPTEGETTVPTTTVPSTTVPTTIDDGKVTYTVKVVDADGKPISGAMVQLCKESCIPGKTNEEGVAEFRVAQDEYKVSFMVLPAGYAYESDKTEFYFESGSLEMTIKLVAAN